MTIEKLTEQMDYRLLTGSCSQEISALVYDSRKIVPGCMFVCIKGAVFDGHTCIDEAAQKQAAAVVVEQDVQVPAGMAVLKVPDTRRALAELSAAWFHHPAKQLKTIGITGTKGKTTTTYMIKSILESTGRKVGLIGTIEVVIGDEHIPAANTTPESYLIQQYFRKMVDAGCDACVMEVSSQGLMMHRVGGFTFDIGILPILSRIISARTSMLHLKIIWTVKESCFSSVKQVL
ncbi:UDP-N-acetylmuramoyl-L-alanyl-D-glutamate--2,6-diaminopimelate ligase [Eubacterium plexicaudatum ASF492]|nr:UDP-N-acetylmuramoyl-L-alanyl-D-glutamate--2,6-diaminopimelate ligase [Eubacterium plexicaudatum ASF492]